MCFVTFRAAEQKVIVFYAFFYLKHDIPAVCTSFDTTLIFQVVNARKSNQFTVFDKNSAAKETQKMYEVNRRDETLSANSLDYLCAHQLRNDMVRGRYKPLVVQVASEKYIFLISCVDTVRLVGITSARLYHTKGCPGFNQHFQKI